MGVDHPYSNVRMHAGPSNHYFLPMGVLHKVPVFERMWPPVLPWAGGAVLLGYALVLLVLGYALNWRRDVS